MSPAWRLTGGLMLIALLMAGSGVATWRWQANSYGRGIAINEANRQADLAMITSAGAAQVRQDLEKQDAAEQAVADLDRTTKQT